MHRLKLRLNPLVLLIFNFVVPLSLMFIHSEWLIIFLTLFSLSILILSGRYGETVKVLILLLILHILYRLCVMNENVFIQTMTMFLFVFIHFMPFYIMMRLLIVEYSSAELISALEKLRLPKIFIISLTISLRYLPTVKKEFSYIKEAMRVRGIAFSIWRPIKSFEYFVVPQLFRCMLLSEEITAAGLTKGIDYPEKRNSYFDSRLKAADYAMLIITFLGIAGLYVWEKL